LGSGATVAANLVDIEAQTDDIGAAGAGLSAIPWNASWDTEVQSEATDALNAYDPPTYDEVEGFVQLLARSDAAITTDRATLLTAINANEGSGVGNYAATTDSNEALRDKINDHDNSLGDVQSDVTAILVDTGTTLPATLAALNDFDPTNDTVANVTLVATTTTNTDMLTAAAVNAEVVDVLNVDTFAEPTGVPAATATLATKLGVLYMMARNKITVTASKKTYYGDDDVAEFEKDLTDDATTYTETEVNAI
jgi:hypothetical protein